MKKISTICMTLVTCLALSVAAQASIVGTLGITGLVAPNPVASDFSAATGLTFGTSFVNVSTGTFAAGGVMPTDLATFSDFEFSPFPIGGVTPLWTVGNYSFDLTSLIIDEQTADELTITGTGIISSTTPGEDDTPGVFIFTGNQLNGSFNFSSLTANVPEPTSILLWGGLAMAVTTIRRRRS